MSGFSLFPTTRSIKGSKSKTHPGEINYTTKKGDLVFHRNGHYVRKSRKPYTKGGKGSVKGTKSKTHRGDMNYTTKKGDKVYHRNRHYVRRTRKPYTK